MSDKDYFETTLRPHARLAILRLLEDAPRYTSNVSMITTLLPSMGISMTRAQIEAEVEWLRVEALVTVEMPTEHLVVVAATVAGVEVAQGIGRHNAVPRPRAGIRAHPPAPQA